MRRIRWKALAAGLTALMLVFDPGTVLADSLGDTIEIGPGGIEIQAFYGEGEGGQEEGAEVTPEPDPEPTPEPTVSVMENAGLRFTMKKGKWATVYMDYAGVGPVAFKVRLNKVTKKKLSNGKVRVTMKYSIKNAGARKFKKGDKAKIVQAAQDFYGGRPAGKRLNNIGLSFVNYDTGTYIKPDKKTTRKSKNKKTIRLTKNFKLVICDYECTDVLTYDPSEINLCYGVFGTLNWQKTDPSMTVFPNWIGGMATFTEVEHFYDPSNPDLAKYSIWKKL